MVLPDQPGFIHHSQNEHANHYTTEMVVDADIRVLMNKVWPVMPAAYLIIKKLK